MRHAREKVFVEWEILVSKEKDVAQNTKLWRRWLGLESRI